MIDKGDFSYKWTYLSCSREAISASVVEANVQAENCVASRSLPVRSATTEHRKSFTNSNTTILAVFRC